MGSKIAASLARTGVGEFVLVDDDVVTPRHELDVGGLGAHKTDALKARLEAIVEWHCPVLDELGTCDRLIDATADPQAFNFVASVASNARRPMMWAETYAGGIGGFVARVRPDKEPPPHAARRQYLAWCRKQGVPWQGDDREYGARTGSERPSSRTTPM